MIESSPRRERRVEQPQRARPCPRSGPRAAPPCRRTRSPTRKGRALSSTVPAITLPSVCCAARPKITAVNAPPSASVRGFDAGHAQRHEQRQHNRREADQEADRARCRGIEAAEQRRSEAAADVARDRPAEDHQHDHRHDRHRRFERRFEYLVGRDRVLSGMSVVPGIVFAQQARRGCRRARTTRDEQRQQHERLKACALDHARADLAEQPDLLPRLAAGLEHLRWSSRDRHRRQ